MTNQDKISKQGHNHKPLKEHSKLYERRRNVVAGVALIGVGIISFLNGIPESDSNRIETNRTSVEDVYGSIIGSRPQSQAVRGQLPVRPTPPPNRNQPTPVPSVTPPPTVEELRVEPPSLHSYSSPNSTENNGQGPYIELRPPGGDEQPTVPSDGTGIQAAPPLTSDVRIKV